MTRRPARALSFHAAYRCRHSGHCCTARWPIPISSETWHRVRTLSDAATSDRPGTTTPPVLPVDAAGCGILPLNAAGCVFHDASAHRCRIHSALGHDALPVACQEFPRVSILEPRGVSITLSCFCPTAQALLDEFDGPIAVVELDDTSSLVSHAPEGLDARTSLPPALRPNLLMDWDSWWAFERDAVALFNRNEPVGAILSTLSAIVDEVRRWRPGDGELSDRVHEAFAAHADSDIAAVSDATADRSVLRQRRFLACHAFANWTAHLGDDLRLWLRSLETVAFLLEEGWTIAEVDLWLRHFADPRQLVKAWGSYEA